MPCSSSENNWPVSATNFSPESNHFLNMKNQSVRKFRFFIPFIIIGVVALVTFAVYRLWNGVLVDVLSVKTITYWQALGIFVLSKILFFGFPGGRGRHCGPPWRRHRGEEHWDSLSPEQREQMREEMRRRFGDWPRPPWCAGESEPPAKPGTPPSP